VVTELRLSCRPRARSRARVSILSTERDAGREGTGSASSVVDVISTGLHGPCPSETRSAVETRKARSTSMVKSTSSGVSIDVDVVLEHGAVQPFHSTVQARGLNRDAVLGAPRPIEFHL